MSPKPFPNLFLVLWSSFFFVGFSEITPQSLKNELTESSDAVNGLLNGAAQYLHDGDVAPEMQCVQKLVPCQPYLHSPTKPPATCCMPLAEMIKNETQCLCSVIVNPAILKTLNITKDDALNLAKSCGAKADLSQCKNETSPTSSPEIPTPSPHADSSNGSSTASSPPTSAAYKTSYTRRSAFILGFLARLVFLPF